MLKFGEFLGSGTSFEYGLSSSSNEYSISFIDNVVGKIQLFFYLFKFKRTTINGISIMEYI